MSEILFSPLSIGNVTLSHRVIMPPLTRMRASEPGSVPTNLMTEYYAQRASVGGLIIAEASQVSQQGKGIPATPGLHNDEQQIGWASIVQAVHDKGGLIFFQLFHAGRGTHSSLQPDESYPVAPSAIPQTSNALTARYESVPREVPHALEVDEIALIVDDYARAARRALEAGFDGLEIHSANGYLLDQFLHGFSNERTDGYGGSAANRARLLLEVVNAVCGVAGNKPVGVRLSPFSTFNEMGDSDTEALFREVIGALSRTPLAYLHLIEARGQAAAHDEEDLTKPPSVAAIFRPLFSRPLIVSGGFTKESAEEALRDGVADAVAFGRQFIANPDLPERFRQHASLNPHDRSSFYGGGAKGYTDYPSLTTAPEAASHSVPA